MGYINVQRNQQTPESNSPIGVADTIDLNEVFKSKVYTPATGQDPEIVYLDESLTNGGNN